MHSQDGVITALCIKHLGRLPEEVGVLSSRMATLWAYEMLEEEQLKKLMESR